MDDQFGPSVNAACRDEFDFTLFFEQAILGGLPAIAFLLSSPLRLAYLARKQTSTTATPKRLLKSVGLILTRLSLQFHMTVFAIFSKADV